MNDSGARDKILAIRTLDGKFIYALRKSLAEVTSWVHQQFPVGTYVCVDPLRVLPGSPRRVYVGAKPSIMTDMFIVTEHTLEELLTL